MNNVEATVCADVLYGLANMVVNKVDGYDVFFNDVPFFILNFKYVLSFFRFVLLELEVCVSISLLRQGHALLSFLSLFSRIA